MSAIDDRGNGPGVWIVDGETPAVSFRPVKLIQLESERALLGGGLRLGERIVALGGHTLHEGQRVRVAEQQVGLK
jgi:multidrug efflux pump subunit AcrA (membrane-fusion protein)